MRGSPQHHLAMARLLNQRAPLLNKTYPVAQKSSNLFRVLARGAARTKAPPKLPTQLKPQKGFKGLPGVKLPKLPVAKSRLSTPVTPMTPGNPLAPLGPLLGDKGSRPLGMKGSGLAQQPSSPFPKNTPPAGASLPPLPSLPKP